MISCSHLNPLTALKEGMSTQTFLGSGSVEASIGPSTDWRSALRDFRGAFLLVIGSFGNQAARSARTLIGLLVLKSGPSITKA